MGVQTNPSDGRDWKKLQQKIGIINFKGPWEFIAAIYKNLKPTK